MMLLLALLVPWAAMAQETLTVHDGTTTNSYVPVYGYYADAYLKCEMVYPATELSTMADGTITSMTFYATSPATAAWTGTWQVSVAEIDTTAISAFTGPGTVVYEGALDGTQSTMEITFSTPYTYNGGNLLVCVYQTATGNYKSITWAGESVNGASVQGYSYTSLDAVSPTQRNFLPKTTFGYLPAGAVYVASPSNLNVTLTPGDGTVATLAWTENGTATQWQICLNGDETNLITASTNPYQLTGLTPETAYTAKVRATTADGESAWSNEVTFKPTNAYQLTVNDGTTTNSYVPYYAYYHDASQRSEFIIPASSLSDLAWGTITSMKFYPNYEFTTNASIKVYLMEVEEEAFSGTTFYGETDATVVYDGTLSISPNGMTIAFAGNGFRYLGGNLLVGFYQSAGGSGYSSSTCPFYGVSATGGSISQYSSNAATMRNFLPKTTFDYIPGEEPACMWPTNLAVSNVTAHTAELSWTSDGTAWQIGYSTDGFVTEQYVEVTENPYTLTGLDPETDYEVRVQTNCGGGTYSVFCTPVAFTTEVACPAPTDLVISDITAYSANVNWSPSEGTFEFRYSPDVRPIANFDDSQMHNWTNIDADGDGYVWVLGSEAAGVYHNAGVDVTGQGYNNSHDFIISGSYSNYAGVALTPDNYLVSPQITLGGSISFWACAQDANYAAEHFGVAVSTTGNTDAADFTTIAEWTFGSRSATVFRSSKAPRGGNRAQTEWVQYTVDLSAYSGQGYVAIRHFGCTDQFMLNVDDIYIEQPGFELPWIYPTTLPALTNLDPETTYIVQVRANCGDEGYSAWLEGTFTTLPACMVPTNLVISNIDKRSADLAWIANGEETQWQICLNGDETNLITVSDTSYSFTNLTPETLYNVKVRAYCDETLQSHWSSPAVFTTLVACPAPTALAISDITNVSAVATWTYDGDVEFEYAEDVWRHYDNGVYSSGIGTGGSDVYWAIMLPPTMLSDEPLTTVSVYEDSNNTEPLTIMIYSGGETAPETLLYEETVNTEAAYAFHEITLAEAVSFDATQNLWIVCKEYGTYPANGCVNTGDANGRWISLNGTEWNDVASYDLDYTWMIRAAFGNNTTEWVAVNNPASPQTITGLTPETPYFVRLRAVCGGEDGESVWVNTSFTTDVACPAPTALAATPYALSAELSWEGISESYTVSYRTAAYTQGVSEEFATSSMPTGWTGYTGLLSAIMEGTATLTASQYTWTFGTGNGVFDSHARCNIYSNYQRWLVTPAIEVPAGAAFSFDMALTAYSGTNVPAPALTGTDDKFVVLVSTDEMASWTILREWNNSGSEYVYNNIANTATGEHVIFDFSAYAGQTVYVAFYGESTENNADNNLHIDNVALGTLVPAGEWMTVNVDEATATITGLTPETKYEWKVQGDCGEYGLSLDSEISTFTTTDDLCPVPTNLAVNAETLTATTADLSWNGSPDVESFTVRYRAPQHAAEGALYEAFGTSIPTGWTLYTGLLDTVMVRPSALASATYGWNFGTGNNVFDNHARVNIYGNYQRWLVTPAIEVPAGANLAFDMALTVYTSGSNASPTPGNQADDKFIVLISTDSLQTWNILRQWDNQGSEYVYDEITNNANGQPVSIDLGAYVGQTVHIAFYGESTASGGDNNLHIDNVIIGEVIPGTEWQTVTTSDMNVTLTGLTPETPYEAQVQNVCSPDSIWSNTVNFTTPEQTTVTQVIALTAGTNWFSTYLDITLEDLQAALVAASSPNKTISIKTQGASSTYSRGRWNGTIDWDVAKMYYIVLTEDIEITLEGMPFDPGDHPVTIVGNNVANWIGFPLSQNMTPANAFSTISTNNDVVKAPGTSSTFSRGRWNGSLTELQPGQGYLYISAPGSSDRILVYPNPSKK